MSKTEVTIRLITNASMTSTGAKNQFMWWRKFHHQVCAGEQCSRQNLQPRGPGTEDRGKKASDICTNWPGLSRSDVLSASVWFFLFPLNQYIFLRGWFWGSMFLFFIIFSGCFIFWDFDSGVIFREANVISTDVKKENCALNISCFSRLYMVTWPVVSPIQC